MKLPTSLTILLASICPMCSFACPFSKTAEDIPSDATHKRLRRRKLAALSEDKNTRESIAAIISERRRSLQSSSCVSATIAEDIRLALDEIVLVINDVGLRGHFIGGIVRLAAHDFMDFDINAAGDELGSDGCLDFDNPANAGLDDIWCDTCELTQLYNVYSGLMSRADFWVLAANAVIKNASPNQSLDLPFRWGRVDSDVCDNSSGRLPEPTSCDDVEGAFITRMGLSWRDAVALLGAHTLGRGHERFSGHPGTWVQNDDESTIFDKQFYTEVVNRGWRPRVVNAPDNDWTWGGNNRGVMMLNTDICLRYDIDDGAPCCTNTNQDCRDDTVQNIQCADSNIVRPEAFQAFQEFEAGRGGDNDAFFSAFSAAWVRATENGYDSLNDLVDTCDGVSTQAPTARATPGEPTSSPTPAPTDEETPIPTSDCNDVDSFRDRKGKTRDCQWVQRKMKCGKYSAECPVTCNAC